MPPLLSVLAGAPAGRRPRAYGALARAIESLRSQAVDHPACIRSAERAIGATVFVGEHEAVDVDTGAIVANCRYLATLDHTLVSNRVGS